MRYSRQLRPYIIGLFVVCLSLLSSLTVHAQAYENTDNIESATLSAKIGDTALAIDGLTSPGAFVQFLEGSDIIGSTTADINGHFHQIFSAKAPGVHTISIFAVDSMGRLTDMIQESVSLGAYLTTTFQVFLPSTISLTTPEVQQGNELGVAGQTIPRGRVTITIDGALSVSVTADAAGNWAYHLPTKDLRFGRHTLSVIVQSNPGQRSSPTVPFPFTVTSRPLPGGPDKPATPVITSPKTGDIVDGSEVTVTGRSQPGLQIELWNHGQPIGSTFADGKGIWSLSISLTAFAYEIVARACIQETCSDFSPAVSFMLRRPPSADMLRLTLERYRFYGNVSRPIILKSHITDGKVAYALIYEWGDGTKINFTTNEVDATLVHQYTNTGKYKGKVTVIDAMGASTYAYFSADMISRGFVWYWWSWLLLLICVLMCMHALGWVYLHQRVIRHHLRRNWKIAKNA